MANSSSHKPFSTFNFGDFAFVLCNKTVSRITSVDPDKDLP